MKLEEINDLNSYDIAKKLNNLDNAEFMQLLNAFDQQHIQEIFPYLSISKQAYFIENNNVESLKTLINSIYTDDLILILHKLPEALFNKVFISCDSKRRVELKTILQFDEDQAASIMSVDIVKLAEEDSVQEALEKIKSQEAIAETIDDCFVTNHDGVLLGMINMKELLMADADVLIEELMNKDVISVHADDKRELAADMMTRYDLMNLAVVDNSHRILGIITIDDVLDVTEESITKQVHKRSAISEISGSYREMSIFAIFKSRVVWLFILMFSATISGLIIQNNQDIALKVPSLLIFLPMLMDTAGNAGSQSSATIIRALAVENLNFSSILAVIKKEISVSLILGIILFTVNFLRIVIFMNNIPMYTAFLISITILIIVLVANIFGACLPMLAILLKQDPSAMSGPVLTTLCDALSLTIYFSLATLFLGGIIHVL